MYINRYEEHVGRHDAADQEVGRQAEEETEREENLSEAGAVRGLRTCGFQRLDPCAAGIPSVPVPGRVHVPAGQPHERVQPRGHADADEHRVPEGRAQIVLRTHQAEAGDVAVRGRRGQVGDENLSGHGRRRMRVQIRPGWARVRVCVCVRLAVLRDPETLYARVVC